MPPSLAATGAAHRAAAELSIASGEAILHKGFAVRPVDNVGQGAAVLVALVLLRIAECQERTISLGAGLPGAERQQTDDQRRCKKSHRFAPHPVRQRTVAYPKKSRQELFGRGPDRGPTGWPMHEADGGEGADPGAGRGKAHIDPILRVMCFRNCWAFQPDATWRNEARVIPVPQAFS
jgi:hypothetical protein